MFGYHHVGYGLRYVSCILMLDMNWVCIRFDGISTMDMNAVYIVFDAYSPSPCSTCWTAITGMQLVCFLWHF